MHSLFKSDRSGANVPSFKAEFYSKSDEPAATHFNRRDFYKIWLINNEGALTIGGQRIHIEKPALIYLNPLEPYVFESLEKDRTGYWCIFTKEFLLGNPRMENLHESALFKLGTNNIFYPNERHLRVINFHFDQIIEEYNSTYLHKYQSIKSHIDLLIHQGMRMQPLSAGTYRHNAASRITGLFLNLLEQQFPIASPQEPLKLKKPKEYADELAVHVNHLNAVVQQVTGKSTSTHIAERMVNESKALLNFSNWSVADIAYSLGFEYPNHFNNFFKKHTGITPLSLRK
jgi:AraC family transcriptional regulator, transcriptional activator of pobA